MKDICYPEKLKIGDEIRVVAPSRSLKLFPDKQNEIGKNCLTSIGLTVTFAKNVNDIDILNCGEVSKRVEDLHEAFLDTNVKAVITVIGGFNVNQIFKNLNFEIIKNNPKFLIGYSDITALLGAITAKTKLATYYGPHFTTFGMKKGIEYTRDKFKEILFNREPIDVEPSKHWADDEWFLDQENRDFKENTGFEIVQEGEAKGFLFGGHLSTFSLLQGTEYFPKFEEGILFLEDVLNPGFNLAELDRYLETFSQVKDMPKVKGVILGRYANKSGVNAKELAEIFKRKPFYSNIPIIYGLDFGHTTPHCVVPIGGIAQLFAKNGDVKIKILNH